MIVISFLGCEEEQFEDSDRNPVSIIQSIETGNYNTFKRKPLFTESLNHVTNLITVDSSTIVEMRHNNYLSYTFLIEDENGLDNRVTNMIVSYIDGNFINKALLDYSFVNQTESGSTDFSPNQLYSFPNGDCGYIVGVYVTPIGTGVDINWQYTLAPCSAGAVDSSNLDPGGVAAVLADLSPSNGGGSNPENSYGLPLHGAYTSYPVTPGYSGYVGGYSDYYGSQPFGPTLYNPNNPPSEGGFYDDLINGNKNITTPILLSASQRFVMNLSPELSQLYDNLTPTQQSSIEDFIEDNNSSYEEYWDAKSFAEEVIEAIANEEVLVEGPDFPIYDLEEYLDVFDTSPTSQASITIYVDQPNPDLPNLPVAPSSGVGHSFISITQGNNTVNYGFYPAEDCGFGWPNPSDGQMGNDENHVFDVSVSVDIDGSTLQTLITHSLSFANTDYILEDMNCTDFALSIANIIGLNISDTDISGSFVIGNGSTPGKFGEFLRNMNLPQGVIRNKDGGTAPSNSVE